MSSPIIKHFVYTHLPPNLRTVSEQVAILANWMESNLPDCAEKSAGLRKLLESKDCFVRAKIEEMLQE